MHALQNQLAEEVSKANVDWGVAIRDLSTGNAIAEFADDVVMSVASVGKVLLLIEVANLAVQGELSLDRIVSRTSVAPVHDSGLWQSMDIPDLTVRDACRLVGAASDNLATNVLLKTVGLGAVQRRQEALGLSELQLHDMVRDSRGPDDPPRLASGSARELVRVMAAIEQDDVGVAGAGKLVKEWLSLGLDLSMAASAFALDPLSHANPDRGIWIFNKTGTDAGVRVDAGVVACGERKLAYAVISNWRPDDRDAQRDSALATMQAIGKLARSYLCRI